MGCEQECDLGSREIAGPSYPEPKTHDPRPGGRAARYLSTSVSVASS